MAKQTIDLGTLGGADGTGDTIRIAGIKINSNFTELFATSYVSSQIDFIGNNITTTLSNSDLSLSGNGTGIVRFSDLTIDHTIRMSDNEITTTQSNSDLILSASGTGLVKIDNVDINGGNIDGTPIGSSTPAAATFTTLSYDNSPIVIDGVTVADNTIKANASNSNLELSANGVGYVRINGINLPNSDGSGGQVLQTNGSGQLSWFTTPLLFDNASLDDGTVTLNGDSTTQAIDLFSASTYRSAKYHIQISDATADRYTLIEANISHDGSTAYISSFGAATNGHGDGSTIYDSPDHHRFWWP